MKRTTSLLALALLILTGLGIGGCRKQPYGKPLYDPNKPVMTARGPGMQPGRKPGLPLPPP